MCQDGDEAETRIKKQPRPTGLSVVERIGGDLMTNSEALCQPDPPSHVTVRSCGACQSSTALP